MMARMPASPALRVDETGVDVLDQRMLPDRVQYLRVETGPEMVEAIRRMAVRGAPAIGVAAAYGLWLFARAAAGGGAQAVAAALAEGRRLLLGARPTAINLAAAVEFVYAAAAAELGNDGVAFARRAADAWREKERARDQRLIANGLNWVRRRFDRPLRVLTHCHTGALATGGLGTALGLVTVLADQGLVEEVWVDETRPLLQGSRLTAWELKQAGIPFRVVVDGAAAYLMSQARVDLVLVGADRIARNGDTANKIGTLGLAVAAHHFGVRLAVVAPVSSVDPTLAEGKEIVIELRDEAEVLSWRGQRVAPFGARAFNPAFDVTPAALIDAWVTDFGVFEEKPVDFAEVVRRNVGLAADS